MRSVVRILIGVMMVWVFAVPLMAQETATLRELPWQAEYFNNPYLAGDPNITRSEDGIGFDWQLAAPDDTLPDDNFSVRWSKGGYLQAGTYRFIVTADHGFRLYLDGEVILDAWDGEAAGVTIGRNLFITAGVHSLQLDYRELDGDAFIFLDWGPAPAGTVASLATGDTVSGNVIVSAGALNVRTEPRIANNIFARIQRGQVFSVLERTEDRRWVHLDLGDGRTGWVSAAYVTETAEDGSLSGPVLRSDVRLLVRSAPISAADTLGLLLPGETAIITGRSRDGAWWQVNHEGTVGWVNASFVTLSPDVDPSQVIIGN